MCELEATSPHSATATETPFMKGRWPGGYAAPFSHADDKIKTSMTVLVPEVAVQACF